MLRYLLTLFRSLFAPTFSLSEGVAATSLSTVADRAMPGLRSTAAWVLDYG